MMQTANIHAVLDCAQRGERPGDDVVACALQEGFALLVTFLNNVDRIAAACEYISHNTMTPKN